MKLEKNMGTADRVIRTIIALIIGALILTGQISGIIEILLGILAIVFILVSIFSFCPLYKLLNISTKK